VPRLLFGERLQDHYVLRVAGESMIEEGIHDGDWVVVERRERARPGEMVVALLGGDEVTLKRFYPEGDEVRLQPANPAMAPLRVAAADVRVQGIVVGLMRRY
jgi:repressor LexA